ncbi:hypothetical protein F2P81_012084 [Scophthalmus maximus]|uniref:Uncharacterized protein n=1 Tax=Scophthalmus maximus TaxID=52904 RepID=A0A6A4T3M9_SCOMX|nr:hypothetical protein F2P81_012084 [Scophthalmus maximus]
MNAAVKGRDGINDSRMYYNTWSDLWKEQQENFIKRSEKKLGSHCELNHFSQTTFTQLPDFGCYSLVIGDCERWPTEDEFGRLDFYLYYNNKGETNRRLRTWPMAFNSPRQKAAVHCKRVGGESDSSRAASLRKKRREENATELHDYSTLAQNAGVEREPDVCSVSSSLAYLLCGTRLGKTKQ